MNDPNTGLPLVVFLPGNDTKYLLPVEYIAPFALGPGGHSCAFCEGDPCAEAEWAPDRIKKFMADCPWESACPFCQGRPS